MIQEARGNTMFIASFLPGRWSPMRGVSVIIGQNLFQDDRALCKCTMLGKERNLMRTKPP
jgi:hypothetical protein